MGPRGEEAAGRRRPARNNAGTCHKADGNARGHPPGSPVNRGQGQATAAAEWGVGEPPGHPGSLL